MINTTIEIKDICKYYLIWDSKVAQIVKKDGEQILGYELMEKKDFSLFKTSKGFYGEVLKEELTERMKGLDFKNPKPYFGIATESVAFTSNQGYKTHHGYADVWKEISIEVGDLLHSNYKEIEYENIKFKIERV
jgi:hypothetical protein